MKYDNRKLKAARELKGWDLTTLAYKCSVSMSTISRIENGITSNAKTIKKLADKLGLDMEDIRLDDEQQVAS